MTETLELADVRTIAARHGIELRGDDGQPYHCGERMEVRSGILGTDYAKCKCGLAIGNMASPHVNGGYVMSDEWFEKHDGKAWARIDSGGTPFAMLADKDSKENK